jgi:hypothetical protein
MFYRIGILFDSIIIPLTSILFKKLYQKTSGYFFYLNTRLGYLNNFFCPL